MYAARLLEGARELRHEEVPPPAPPPGWALLKVEAAGLCHTDLHVMDGVQFSAATGIDYTVYRPRILGHEVAGTVVQVGEGVNPSMLGAAVAAGGSKVPGATPGMHIDGGFAEFCTVPAANLVRIAKGVDFGVAAVATDSVRTAYAAVTGAGAITSEDRVAVIGLGGLGMSAVRSAVLHGAEVYGIDIDSRRFDAAAAAGASRCSSSVMDLVDLRPTLVVDFVGGSTTADALSAVQLGGRVVLVGLGAREVTIDPIALTLGKKSLIGSVGAFTPTDFEDVMALLGRGELTPQVEEIPFAEINAGYDRLRRGEVQGRLFTRPGPLK